MHYGASFGILLIFFLWVLLATSWWLKRIQYLNTEESKRRASLDQRGNFQGDPWGTSGPLSKSIGSNLIFEYKVDKELIGGLKLQLGSFMIDTSVKNKLKKYEQSMIEK